MTVIVAGASMKLVIPGRGEAAKPGNHNHEPGLWVPGSRPSVSPRDDGAMICILETRESDFPRSVAVSMQWVQMPRDLDHRRFRHKADLACGGCQRCRDLGRGGLADDAAALADQKDNEIARRMIMHAGDEGVAARDAVHQPFARRNSSAR